MWSTLIKIRAKTYNDEATYRVKKDFEALIIGSNEKVGEYFVRVKVLILREEKHNVNKKQESMK